MKLYILLIILLLKSFILYSQDVMNQYNTPPILNEFDLEILLNSNPNDPLNFPIVNWHNPANIIPFYDGEYEINILSNYLFWSIYFNNSGNGLALSYNIEVVSFPFIPDCIKEPQGCGANNPNINRNFQLPNDPYDNSTKSWDYVKRIIPNTKFNQIGSSLASYAYAVDDPVLSTPVRNYFPHSILKHTVNIHCESNSSGNPTTSPIFSFSWIHDNTRGRMKYYPFCPNGDANCSFHQYDVSFAPRLINKVNHIYNESNPNSIIPITGTLNYFDYSDIINFNCNILTNATTYPLQSWPFTINNNYLKVYFPPYSLVSAPLYQSRGVTIAGYERILQTTDFQAMYGIPHNYQVNYDFDIEQNEISESDGIFYNPSDVTITAPNLTFPSNYSFRTIRGIYPSPTEVAADNTAINGGPFNDLRHVPVRTDLRCEDASFPHSTSNPDDAKYASLYRLASGSKLTLDPCVRVFDAAFILNPGSTLELANKTTIIGLHRVAIDRNGGRLIEKYELNSGTLYLQDKTETALAPNSYYVNSKIFAGENVEPSSPIGPYIASTGTDLELIARDYIKLDHGFHAEPGAEVKIRIDPSLQIPACPQPISGGSGNRFAQSSSNSAVEDASNHIKLMPTLFTNSTGIYSENINEDPIVSVEVLDASGKKIKQINEINDYFVEIDLSSMNDGMYFFIIQTKNNRKVLKGVKQN